MALPNLGRNGGPGAAMISEYWITVYAGLLLLKIILEVANEGSEFIEHIRKQFRNK